MKYFSLSVLLLILLGRLSAVPANPRPVEKIQPDGTKITVRIKGDERIHWMESLDGYTLMYNNKQEVVFAVHDKNGNLTPSKILYIGEDLKKYSASKRRQIRKIPPKLYYSEEQISTMIQIKKVVDDVEQDAEVKKKISSTNKAQAVVLGTHKVLVILAQFSDKKNVKSASDFQNLMNQVGYTAGGNTGSVRDFYRENSYGKMDIEVTVVGPVTCNYTASYYGSDEWTWSSWAKEVATKADELIDYSQFAKNGYVPNFHIIFAGYGDEAIDNGEQIWSHKSSFDSYLVADGVRIGQSYSCSPELRDDSGSNMTYIGVICHELCHAFGAPDYYDTDYSSYYSYEYEGTGHWDLMASGSWNNDGATPAHINMWQKIVFGWVNPTELTEASSVKNMPSSADSAHAYWIKANSSGERYVLENRQQKKFDSHIPGHGLLIYHIHKNALGGNCNNKSYPQEVYPVCASSTTAIPNTSVSSYGKEIDNAGCPFPGASNKKSFGGTTTPAMFSWSSSGSSGTVVTGKDITNITENTTAKTVSFDFMGGGDPPVPAPEPVPCKDSITTFPFVWGFEDMVPCYNFGAVEAAATGQNAIGILADGDELTYSDDVSARTGSYAWVFSSYNKSYLNGYSGTQEYNQYMISPCIIAPADKALRVEYWYRKTGSSSESFRVGYSSTNSNMASFTWTSNRINATSNWQLDTLKVPAGTKYIAINYNSEYKYHLLIDDLRIDLVNGDGTLTEPSEDSYVLISSASQLVAGEKYIVVGKGSNDVWYGLGSQQSSNRQAISLDLTSSTVPDSFSSIAIAMSSNDFDNVYQITLDGVSDEYMFYDSVNGMYLAATSSSDNLLQFKTTPAYWTINFDNKGAATIICITDNYIRNKIRFDVGNSLFSCYSSGFEDVYLYIRKAAFISNKISDEKFYNAETSVKIYPNPTSGKFNVVVSAPAVVEVFTQNGVRVDKKQVDEKAEFNLQRRGLYLLRVTDAKGGVSTQKIIVK